MSARNEDFLFAQEAQSLGYVTEEQVDEGFLLQRRMANDLQIDERLSVILVKRGWIAEEQARRVYGIIEPGGAHTQIEGYTLLEKIGSGAMGTVYKARHEGLKRIVAIKILRRDLAADKTQIERLKREAKLLAELDHPNIVRAFDAGESNGFPYLVLEYVEGETLRDRIAREGALSNEEALRITRALADALEKARRMGVVHRDVKPGNILVSKAGGVPKLMDLGLAKGPIDLQLTQQGATVGTPQFMSPEQAESPEKADIRSDIYSLGASLYAMVTTRPPFEGSTLAEIITKVMTRQPVPPRVRNEDVSPEVSHLIERMMLKDPSLRYATPAQVVADIDMIRGGQSIIPRGFQGNWEAYLLRQRWRKRKKWLVGAGAALLVLGLGLAMVMSHFRREEYKRRANEAAERVLRVPRPEPTVLRKALELHVQEAREQFEEMKQIEARGEVAAAKRDEAELRLEELQGALQALIEFDDLQATWDRRLAAGEFRDVDARVRVFESRVKGREPAHSRWAAYLTKVGAASENAWKVAQAKVIGRSAPTIEAFVSQWADYADVLEGAFILTKDLRTARTRARPVSAAAARIGGAVEVLQRAFAEDALKPRVEALEFYDLKNELRSGGAQLLQVVEAESRAMTRMGAPLERAALDGPNGLVTGVLRRLGERLDAEVRAHWDRLQASVDTLEPVDAIGQLTRFEVAAARGSSYDDLARRAETLRRTIEEKYERDISQAERVRIAAINGVLEGLRDGAPAEMRARIDAAASDPRLDAKVKQELGQLAGGADALEALQRAALIRLESLRKDGTLVRDVRVRGRDGLWEAHTRWTLQSVDPEKGLVRVKRQRKGSRPDAVEIPIRRVDLEQVRAWARRSGAGVPPLADPLVDLALLPPERDDPGQDMRLRLAAYRQVLADFEALEATGAWTELTRKAVTRLEFLQARREEEAEDNATRINILFNQPGRPEYKRVISRWERLSDPGGRLRYTDSFDSKRADLSKTAELCRAEIEHQELLRLFEGGVDVDELEAGRHRIRFDFDDPPQMGNFLRVFGELEPTGGAITPYARGYRLTLLKGVKGLLLDRPLTLENMFDTSEKIRLGFSIDTSRGRGASLLAIDIDGVQIAISSLDPNYWRWKFPRGTPLIDDEERLPEYDFYGRGRGIAFHHGPDFGRSFPLGSWTWDKLSDAANFEKWKDRSYLRRHRDVLFAFEPGQTYRVVVERERDTLRLIVDGEQIVQQKNPRWDGTGKHRVSGDRFRNGSGLLQILTTTPLAIDDLILEGMVRPKWREQRKRQIKEKRERQINEKRERQIKEKRDAGDDSDGSGDGK